MTYASEYEKVLQYNATHDDVHGLLSGMKEEHRHPSDSLSPHRAAASDALAETGRDREAGYLADPQQHVMILPHPDTKQLEVHPAKFEANPFTPSTPETRHPNSLIRDNFRAAYAGLSGLASYQGRHEDPIHAISEDAGGDFINDFRESYHNMGTWERKANNVPVDWETNNDAILPPLPLNHHRVFYGDNTEKAYRYKDVHAINMPEHLARHIESIADDTGYDSNPEDMNPQANDDENMSMADYFHRGVDNLRNTPVERRLTTSELNKLHESQET